MTSAVPFHTVFASALRGDACLVFDDEAVARHLPVDAWSAEASAADQALLDECVGPTLDIGCGPGRMAQHLAARGQVVLGIDLVPEAVRQTVARGASAMVRDVFAPVPAEGRWATALLADGNIGIGGDPAALLARVRQLLALEGRIVLDLAPPGSGLVTRPLRLQTSHGITRPFPWTVVGVEAIADLAAAAGLVVASVRQYADRWFAVLRPDWSA